MTLIMPFLVLFARLIRPAGCNTFGDPHYLTEERSIQVALSNYQSVHDLQKQLARAQGMGDYLPDREGNNLMPPPVSDQAPVTVEDYEQMVSQVPGLAPVLPPLPASGGGAANSNHSGPVREWREGDGKASTDSDEGGDEAYETPEAMESMPLFASQAAQINREPVVRVSTHVSLVIAC